MNRTYIPRRHIVFLATALALALSLTFGAFSASAPTALIRLQPAAPSLEATAPDPADDPHGVTLWPLGVAP